ncbi:TetR family transcriptional regulator [Humibacter sp.]|uniref:TetR family transcriptional regulator n=1 Tax=Humibacter sp. TaxID=1940291 RepID=UPI003F7F4729
MSRWRPDARERLEAAALELFERQGFAATTVPQIAERAGLTTRTFFRYFADKREVMYAGDQFPALVARIFAEAPADASPVDLVTTSIQRFSDEELEHQRDTIRRRSAIIQSDPGLRERSLRKRADLSEAVRDGLLRRGVPDRTAALLADMAATVFEMALSEWIDGDGERALSVLALENLNLLREALAV